MQLIAALPTPFDRRGRLDIPRFKAHLLWLRALGIDGFAPTGTTGEFLYLEDHELAALHQAAIEAAGGHPVFVGPWRPSEERTAQLCQNAASLGATGAFLPPPIYYGLGEEQVATWYRRLAERTGLPLYGYHIPHYARNGLSPALYRRLVADGVLVGMKDSGKDLERLRRLAPLPGTLYVGGDRLLPDMPSLEGAAGFVSAAVNAWPSLALRLVQGEDQLRGAWAERVRTLRRAGGLRALKPALGFGCRAPLHAVASRQLAGLPQAERP